MKIYLSCNTPITYIHVTHIVVCLLAAHRRLVTGSYLICITVACAVYAFRIQDGKRLFERYFLPLKLVIANCEGEGITFLQQILHSYMKLSFTT